MPKFYECVLCKSHPKGNYRQTLSKEYSKILQRNFGVCALQGSTICNKCRFKCYKISKEKKVNTSDTLRSPNQPEQTPRSPPFVRLPLSCTSSSHSYCCVCKRPGPKLVVVKTHARLSAYIGAEIFVPEGSRCCPNHIQNDVFSVEAISKMTPVKFQSTINKSAIMDMLSLMREQLMSQRKTRLDFDSDTMTDLDYATLTGLSKHQFDELMTDIQDLRTSKSRTSRTCIAIFLTKMRSSLSNRMLSVLFNMTKFQVRWVVESVNGRIKTWRYLDKVLPNSQIPYIGDYVRIICALCNKFRPPLNTGTTDEGISILSRQNNILKMKVEQEGMDKRSFKWKKVDSADVAADFPHLTEEEIRNITIGVYQIKMAKSYVHEHLDDDGVFEILVSDEIDNVLSAQIQSRHTSAKRYTCFIYFENGSVTGWYCK